MLHCIEESNLCPLKESVREWAGCWCWGRGGKCSVCNQIKRAVWYWCVSFVQAPSIFNGPRHALHLSPQRTFCVDNFPLVLPRAWSRQLTSLFACTIISSKLHTSAVNPGGFASGLRKYEWQNELIRPESLRNKRLPILSWQDRHCLGIDLIWSSSCQLTPEIHISEELSSHSL